MNTSLVPHRAGCPQIPGRRSALGAVWRLLAGLALAPVSLMAAPDLYIKDCPADTGVEPNNACGVYYLSEDIWVRQNPIPGYQVAPFVADPGWLTAISPLHQNPEYRDPKFSRPNYVYVRVRNRGSTASTGNERLRVYWAKASTGLSWPSQWVDYMANNCGPNKLYGIEITKPRKNAATATAAERTDYINAILAIDSAPYQWAMGNVTYWDNQDQVHQLAPEHGTPAFLPWHREMLSRYEVLLREANPIVTLLYWDWTTDPTSSTGGFNLMTAAFMGTANGVVGAPLSALHANGVCANSRNGFTFPGGPNCNLHFNDWTYPPPNLYRDKDPGAPGVSSDTTVLNPTTYQSFDNMEGNPHGSAHVYMGGNMGSVPTATEDPFFFLLHANCDRLWANWQRTNNPAYLGRLTPATAYDGESGHARINATMQPWDGSSSIAPWMPGVGSYTSAKTPKDPSVVFPPVYDTAPLRVPQLQPGESIVIEIPWYPPNPADFACFGVGDQGHVCLLARIETSATAPFGMTIPELSNLGENVRNNNNIAWKNVTVQDTVPGLLLVGSVWLRNLLKEITLTRLQLRIPVEERNNPVLNYGNVYLDLGTDLYDRWRQAGGKGQGIEPVGNGLLQIFGADAFIADVPLRPDEIQQVRLQVRLNPQYRHPDGQVFSVDLDQYGTARNPDEFVGGQRFTFDFNKLTAVPRGARWRYLDDGRDPGDAWTSPDFDDAKWALGQAELGFGDFPVTTVDGGPADSRHITTWFRHTFDVPDPSVYRNVVLGLKVDDGAIVYLNGQELFRLGLPANAGPDTLADLLVEGAREETFLNVPVPKALELLRRGRNVLAVEVHQHSKDSPDLSFDLELSANTLPLPLLSPPAVTILSPRPGSLHLRGLPIQIEADAIDPGGDIGLVTFYDNDNVIGRVRQAPYRFSWSNAPAGPHRLTAIALDSDGQGASAHTIVSVVSNLPPVVDIVRPLVGDRFEATDSIAVRVDASDTGGSVRRIELYLRHHHEFGIGKSVAIVDGSTLATELRGLEPEDWVLTAQATDDGGATTLSLPISFSVSVPTDRPTIAIHPMLDHLMLSWTPPGARLQEADAPQGPWREVPDAPNPFTVRPGEKARFYRAYVP